MTKKKPMVAERVLQYLTEHPSEFFFEAEIAGAIKSTVHSVGKAIWGELRKKCDQCWIIASTDFQHGIDCWKPQWKLGTGKSLGRMSGSCFQS